MSKNITSLLTASAMMAIPLLSLTSCDSEPPNTGGSSTFELGNRYDQDTLAVNPAGTVEMPAFLLQGDSFTHNVVVVDPLRIEYGQGFQASDPAIIVDGAGQISTAEGDSLSVNVGYIYEPDSGSFALSEQNSFPANFGNEAIRDDFENRMEAIENVPFAQIGSLAEAISGQFTGDEAARIYEVAIESIGLISSDVGPTSIFTLGGEIVTNTTVRIRRRIAYEPTSTNGTLLSTGEITGNVTITDTYVDVRVLLPHDNRGRVLALEPTTAITNILTGNIIEYNGIITYVESHVGTFNLTLNSSAF